MLREAQPLRATEQDFVFTTESGGALDADRFVERHWRPALRACGMKLRPLKATRHTFISVALSRGSKPRWVAKYCGTSLDMLDRHYSRWMDGDDAELAQLQIARPSPLEAVG